MSLLENAKRFAEKTTGWRRPEDPKLLLRDRKPRTFKFKDDGHSQSSEMAICALQKRGPSARIAGSRCGL